MARSKQTRRNVNLDHHIASAPLLTTSAYKKVKRSDEHDFHKKVTLDLRDFLIDESGLGVWHRLRKPEFQRSTNSWADETILSFLKTLTENQVIPGVIFWLNKERNHIFVLDGAHRLCVIRAWLTDDWGDSEAAKSYGFLEDAEMEAADRIRELVNDRIGSYQQNSELRKRFQDLVDRYKEVSEFLDPESERIGRFMYNLSTSLSLPIQWVTGNYETAEQSFININTGGTPLSDQEVHFLTNRRSPAARAISGIISNGTRESLWIKHKDECQRLSRLSYQQLLEPSDTYTASVADYPLCFVKKQKTFDRYLFLHNVLCVANYQETGELSLEKLVGQYANETNDVLVARETLQHLRRAGDVLSEVHGKGSRSLGLYPAFYYYSSTGLFRELLFLLFLAWASHSDREVRASRKFRFTLVRGVFEDVWMLGKDYIFRSLGAKGAGPARMTRKHIEVIDELVESCFESKDGRSIVDIVANFLEKRDKKVHTEFLKSQNGSRGKPYGRFSEATKAQTELRALFDGAHRCAICGGRVILGSHQIDHMVRRGKGGTDGPSNARVLHPFCNHRRDDLEAHGLCFELRDSGILRENEIRIPLPYPDPSASGQLTFSFPSSLSGGPS